MVATTASIQQTETTAGKPVVLLLGAVDHALTHMKDLEEVAEVITPPEGTVRETFLADLRAGKYDTVSVVLRTFASVALTGRFDDELIEALPASVKFICHNGAGYDQVDIAPCTARNILVSNVPTAVDDATADVNMFLIIGALRGFNLGMTKLRRKEWRYGVGLAHDPQGKVLGIYGMGGIGRNLAKKARAFGMKIIYHNSRRLPEELEGDEGEEKAEYCSTLKELLERSDVVSVNCPLNEKTRHTLSTEQFSWMKDGVVIVNTARGAVIDEDALVVALDSGKVRSVGLDVYEDEPEIREGLLTNENVMLIPHMGTHTVETQLKMEEWWLDNAIQAVKEGALVSAVPEQVPHYGRPKGE